MAKPNKTYYRKIKNLFEEYEEEVDEGDEVDGRNRVLFIENKEDLKKNSCQRNFFKLKF